MLQILVPTDFSDNALRAMRVALLIARRYNAEVTFVHAMANPTVPATSPEEVFSTLYHSQREEASQQLHSLCNQLYQEYGLRPKEVIKEIKVVAQPVSEAVMQVAYSKNVQLIVMGVSGSSAVEKLLFGSNTRAILRHATVPVLLIPPAYTFSSFDSISVVLHIKHLGKRPGLELLEKLAHSFSPKLYLLNITDGDTPEPDDIENAELPELFTANGYTLVPLPKSDKYNALENHLMQAKTKLLVWLPKQSGIWSESLSESFAEQVAAKANVPLLVIPHAADSS